MSYTKHYYLGSERVSAKTGTVERLGIFPKSLLTTHMPGLDQLPTGMVKSTSNTAVSDANTMVSGVYTKFELTKALGVKTVDDRDDASFAHVQGLLNIFYFHPDHLGSSSYITNQDGTATQHMEYLPFGETLVDEHTNSISTPFKFNGKEFDEETNNYYYEARYYDPKWSIFISVDPLAEEYLDWTPYRYGFNNPVRMTDPSGMLETDFLNTETLETLHVEDGNDQIVLLNDKQFNEVKNIASLKSWNRQQSERYEKLSSNNVHDMDSDLGILSRLVYSEMESGDDNAKAIVAESAINRTKMKLHSYPNPDGTLTSAINKKGAYDVTNPESKRHDEFINPYASAKTLTSKMDAWLDSIKAAYNAINGSDVGKGTTNYNSSSSTYYDKNPGYEKINLDVTHTGIKGTWKLRY